VPEHNLGYPTVLKNTLGHIHHEWNNESVAFVRYGEMARDSRGVQQLRQVVIELQVAPIRTGDVIAFARRRCSTRMVRSRTNPTTFAPTSSLIGFCGGESAQGGAGDGPSEQ
jgi:NAD(P)H-dependent FMN reductase